MSENTIVFADEFGEYNDWFELFNGSDTAINIAGLYFSTDYINNKYWQIPRTILSGTLLQPDSFVIVWADEQLDQGPLHTGFNLSSNGGQIAMIQINHYDTSLIDMVNFSSQVADFPYGRLPDGYNDWNKRYPTPKAPNKKLEDISLSEMKLFPNPSSDYFEIVIDNVVKEKLCVTIYNYAGLKIAEETVDYDLHNKSVKIDASGLNTGMYFCNVVADNFSKTVKILIAR